jgi:pimeloyl-ACP methyl ester carboxylesterase
MPGFGEAARLDREREVLPQLDRFAAAAVRDVAEREGDVVLAGNSLGGAVSMRIAERAELPIAGIAPIAPAGLDMAQWFTIIETAPIVRALLRAPVPLPEAVVRDAVGRAYRSMAFTKPSAVDATAVASFTRHFGSRRDVIRILATGRRLKPELSEARCFRLERIACPVLLVWGDSDKMVYPSGSERVLREVADVRYEVIPSCGHCPQVECPRALADLLDGFPAQAAGAGANFPADAEAA